MWNYIKLVIGVVIIIYAILFLIAFNPFTPIKHGDFFTSKDIVTVIILLICAFIIGGYLIYNSFKKLTQEDN